MLIVLDGLRPDLVTPGVMPNLCALAAEGTELTRARSVFPSVTAVAAASIATGAYPAVHGIVGNELFRIGEPGSCLRDLRDYRVARGLDQALPQGLVEGITFADVMASAGRRLAIVDGGMPIVSTLVDPRAARHRHWSFSTAGRDCTATPRAWDAVVARFGFPPERELPHFDEVSYATDVLIDHVLAEIVPDVAVLWLPEPDATSRWREIGSLEAENTLRHVDRHLGRVIDAVRRKSRGERTTIIVASDHGQLSVTGGVDVLAALRSAGFDAAGRGQHSEAGIVVSGQGYGALTLPTRDPALEDRLIGWLMGQSWVGNVMTRARAAGAIEGRVPGSLALERCGLGHRRAPDVMFTFRHEAGLDRHGVEGRGLHNWAMAGCRGTHGGLSAMEMSTVLVAAGPGFKAGLKCPAVAGIVDIAATILARLGLAMPHPQGRDLANVLFEERREVVIETGADGYAQSVVMGHVGAGRLEMAGRGVGLVV